ncbi:MAG: hypothetical protein ABSF23_18190 [Terracidiphilus sp.]|jgi:hypothetical protein
MPNKKDQPAIPIQDELPVIIRALRQPAGYDPHFQSMELIRQNRAEFLKRVHATWKQIHKRSLEEILQIEAAMIACTESVDWKNTNNEKRGSHDGCDQHHRLMNLASDQFLACGRQVADQPLGPTSRFRADRQPLGESSNRAFSTPVGGGLRHLLHARC